MPITIRDDAVYLILSQIDQAQQGNHAAEVDTKEINLAADDFIGIKLDKSDLLGHLDYLNQKQYIDAEFSGNAYAKQEDVPNLVNPDEVNVRVANTLGAEDGPLPHLITLKRAKLTAKGEAMLNEMKENPPENLSEDKREPIPESEMSFLQKVMHKGNLSDLYDARDVTEVVFRVMRDMMTTQQADQIAAELSDDVASQGVEDKSLHVDVAELWQDTNPIVRFLSRLRPPLRGEAPFGIDSELFLKRVDREASVPKTSNGETVTRAVFAATKDELSEERVQEIAAWLPVGRVQELWQTA
ncbi:DUF2267 domain-containing protein [Leptolyngbya iicbica]|uniref:DUF2267 domain-containing protein n=2 Tax=Cyanophyceae TaxID=3028117 RepID=A0A4Q7E3F8_9CYAN|nr:DUF2267 domain-containing protein [Leptolyngbya sp. LK]RZM76547.1 DUF2267 domain-containing protein [Leptolyngbya sp. LK]